MKKLIIILTLSVFIILPSCKDSTLEPPHATVLDPEYIFYTYYDQNSNKMDIRRFDINNMIDTLLKENTYLIGVVNGKVYHPNSCQTPNSINSCDEIGQNETIEYTLTDAQFVLPTISNDGEKILYMHKRNTNTWNANCIDLTSSTENQVIHTDYMYDPIPIAAFSSDSKNIGFISLHQTHPWNFGFLTCNVDGSNIEHYGRFEAAYGNMRGSWSPDSKNFAYLSVDGANYKYDISIFNINTQASVEITQDEGQKLNLSWSPDGSKIAFYRNPGEFCLINSDGSQEQKITMFSTNNKISVNYNEEILGLYPVWSEDGNRILFQTYKYNSYGDIYAGDLKIYDLKTNELRTLVKEEKVFNAFFNDK